MRPLRDIQEDGTMSETAYAINVLGEKIDQLTVASARHELSLAILMQDQSRLQYWARWLVATATTTALAVLGSVLFYLITHR